MDSALYCSNLHLISFIIFQAEEKRMMEKLEKELKTVEATGKIYFPWAVWKVRYGLHWARPQPMHRNKPNITYLLGQCELLN